MQACTYAHMAVASCNLEPVPASAFRSPSAAHSNAVLTRRRRRTMLGTPVRSYAHCALLPSAACVCAKKVARKQAPCSALHYKIMQRLRATTPPPRRLCSANARGSFASGRHYRVAENPSLHGRALCTQSARKYTRAVKTRRLQSRGCAADSRPALAIAGLFHFAWQRPHRVIGRAGFEAATLHERRDFVLDKGPCTLWLLSDRSCALLHCSCSLEQRTSTPEPSAQSAATQHLHSL